MVSSEIVTDKLDFYLIDFSKTLSISPNMSVRQSYKFLRKALSKCDSLSFSTRYF